MKDIMRITNRILFIGIILFASMKLHGQETWYVNNVIGSDSYTGKSSEVQANSEGPIKTITKVLQLCANGDIIVVSGSSTAYSTVTGETSPIIVTKSVTFRSSNAIPIIEAKMKFDDNRGAYESGDFTSFRSVEFSDEFQLMGGMELIDMNILGGSNIFVDNTLHLWAYDDAHSGGNHPLDPRIDEQINYLAGTIDVIIDGKEDNSDYTVNFAFPDGQSQSSLRNITIGVFQKVEVYLNNGLYMHGSLTLMRSSTLDLNGNTATFYANKDITHNISGNIKNGMLEYIMDDDGDSLTETDVNVAASGMDLPSIKITGNEDPNINDNTPDFILSAKTIKDVSIYGAADVVLQPEGSNVVPTALSNNKYGIDGNLINAGSGVVEIDVRDAEYRELAISGKLEQSGSGQIRFKNIEGDGIYIKEDVNLATNFVIENDMILSNKAVITFPEAKLEIGGSLRNTASFSGNTNKTISGNAIILVEAENYRVKIGNIINSTSSSLNTNQDVDGLFTGNGKIIFNWEGADYETADFEVTGSMINSSAHFSLEETNDGYQNIGNGQITFMGSPHNSNLGSLEIKGNIINTSSSSTSSTNGLISLEFKSQLSNSVRIGGIQSTGGFGGDILLGDFETRITGSIVSARTEMGADIIFGTAIEDGVDDLGLSITGIVTNEGKSDIIFYYPQRDNGGEQETISIDGIILSGTGRIVFDNVMNIPVSLGDVTISDGLLDFATNTEPTSTITLNEFTITGGKADFSGTGSAPGQITSNNFKLLNGIIDFGLYTGRVWSVNGINNYYGGEESNPTIICTSTTTLKFVSSSPSNQLQTLFIGESSPTWQGSLFINNLGNISEQVRLVGDVLNVKGLVTFQLASITSHVILDGCKLYCERTGDVATDAFQNYSGYRTINGGRVSIVGNGNCRISGNSSVFWGDFEINTKGGNLYQVTVNTNPGIWNGNIFLTSGKLLNESNNIIIENQSTYPTIIRDLGQFEVEPDFRSKVNVTYLGSDKTTSFELPIISEDKLNNIIVATTTGAKTGKGIITLDRNVRVNGKIQISSGQTLKIAEEKYIEMVGDSVLIDGYFVNSAAPVWHKTNPENVLVLNKSTGTVFVGNGVLPDIQINESSVGNIIGTGSPVLIENNYLGNNDKWDNTVWTDDFRPDIDDADGEIRLMGSVNSESCSVTLNFSEPVTKHGSNIGTITLTDEGNTVTLSSSIKCVNLILSSGTLNINENELTILGDSEFNSGTNLTGTGKLVFQPVMNLPAQIDLTSDTDSSIQIPYSMEIAETDQAEGNYLRINGISSTRLDLKKSLSIQRKSGLNILNGVTVSVLGDEVNLKNGARIVANGDELAGTGLFQLSCITDEMQFSLEDSVYVENIVVSGNNKLVGNEKRLSVKNFTHVDGNFNLGSSCLVVDSSYNRLIGTYNDSKGWLVLGPEVDPGYKIIFNQGRTDFSLPKVKFNHNIVQDISIGSGFPQTGVITIDDSLTLNGEVQIRNENDTNNKVILQLNKDVFFTYSKGGFYYRKDNADSLIQSPGFSSIALQLACSDSLTIPESVWPEESDSLVTKLIVNNKNNISVRLPGNRIVRDSVELLNGLLNFNGNNLIVENPTVIIDDEFDNLITDTGAFVWGEGYPDIIYSLESNFDADNHGVLFSPVGNVILEGSSAAVLSIDKPIVVMGNLELYNGMMLNNELSLKGNLTIGANPLYPSVTGIAAFMNQLIFSGEESDQIIMVPSEGAAIGSIEINKESGNVSLLGGDLTLAENLLNQSMNNFITFKKGLFLTNDNTLTLKAIPGTVLSGFSHIPEYGDNSHVVGNLAIDPKTSFSLLTAHTTWPVGSVDYYRPITLTFLSTQDRNLGTKIIVSHVDENPEGTFGLPISYSNNLISYYPDFYWSISCENELLTNGLQYDLSFTAEGFVDYSADIDDLVILRRFQGDAQANSWHIQGTTYDNSTINNIPVMRTTTTSGAFTNNASIFTIGIPTNLTISSELEDLIIGIETAEVDFGQIFGGNEGALIYSVSVSDDQVLEVPGEDFTSTSFVIKGLSRGQVTVTLRATDITGDFLTTSFEVEVDPTVDLEEFLGIPEEYHLAQNYPNPFNPATNIRFGLPDASVVTLRIYNLLGEEVATVVNNVELAAGYHSYNFNAGNLTSGLYIYRIEAGNFVEVKKMLLMK